MPRSEVQFFACWTQVDIALSLIAKAIRAKVCGTMIVVRKCHIRTHVLGFQGDNVLFGAIFAIPGDLSRPQFPAEASPENKIEHGLVLHDFGRCDESGQDNPRFAPINDIVGLVTQVRSILSTGYREFVPSLRSNCSTV